MCHNYNNNPKGSGMCREVNYKKTQERIRIHHRVSKHLVDFLSVIGWRVESVGTTENKSHSLWWRIHTLLRDSRKQIVFESRVSRLFRTVNRRKTTTNNNDQYTFLVSKSLFLCRVTAHDDAADKTTAVVHSRATSGGPFYCGASPPSTTTTAFDCSAMVVVPVSKVGRHVDGFHQHGVHHGESGSTSDCCRHTHLHPWWWWYVSITRCIL